MKAERILAIQIPFGLVAPLVMAILGFSGMLDSLDSLWMTGIAVAVLIGAVAANAWALLMCFTRMKP